MCDGWLREIVGSVVTDLLVSEDEGDLVLVCGSDALVCSTEGDCCSESWWADAVGVKQLLGARVVDFEEVEMPGLPYAETSLETFEPTPSQGGVDRVTDPQRTRQEQDQLYGYRVKTDRGACDLIFRNSSNGYYGGWADMEWVENYEAQPGFRQITEDWSA